MNFVIIIYQILLSLMYFSPLGEAQGLPISYTPTISQSNISFQENSYFFLQEDKQTPPKSPQKEKNKSSDEEDEKEKNETELDEKETQRNEKNHAFYFYFSDQVLAQENLIKNYLHFQEHKSILFSVFALYISYHNLRN